MNLKAIPILRIKLSFILYSNFLLNIKRIEFFMTQLSYFRYNTLLKHLNENFNEI